jgi:hypothetical protein
MENVSRAHHPNAFNLTNDGVFPGAIREGGSNNEVGHDEDDLTIESRTDSMPPTVAAELVNIEEEERLVQDQINEALRRERQPSACSRPYQRSRSGASLISPMQHAASARQARVVERNKRSQLQRTLEKIREPVTARNVWA